MKYRITATPDEITDRRSRTASLPSADSLLLGFGRRHWGVVAALAFTLLIHAPTLRYFFAGDDFILLGNMEWRGSSWGFVIDSFRLEDYVPSWRPLSAVIYVAEWRLFGLNAAPWRALALIVHLASMTLLYALLTRTLHKPGVAASAALIFGVSGAHYQTVTYVTAFPHVLETFFVLASLLTLVSYAQDGEHSLAAFAFSFVLFALAFLANESAFVYAVVLVAAYALFSQRWAPLRPLRLVFHAAPFVAIAAGWLVFYQSSDNFQIKFADGTWGTHVFSGYALYLSWLLYPAHTIPLDPDALRWVLGGVVALAVLLFAVRGPDIARLAAIGVFVALLPFVPVVWTTSRYAYGAVAFFAPLAAISAAWIYERLSTLHRHARIPANMLALALVAAIAALYAWQSNAHNAQSGRDTDRWRLLVDELRANEPSVASGTTIWIVDGPWTEPLSQYTEVPNVARALYGDASAFDLPRAQYQQQPPHDARQLFLEWDGAHLRPTSEEDLLAGR